MNISSKFGLASLVFLTLGGILFTTKVQNSWVLTITQGFLSILSILTGFICGHIYILQPADSHTFTTLITQYIFLVIMRRLGDFIYYHKLPLWGATCLSIQKSLLLKILKRAANTDYGKEHKLSQIKDVKDFQKTQPLTDYLHYKSYIDKIMDGKERTLFVDNVTHVALTSGTTGKNKLFPLNKTVKNPITSFLFVRTMVLRSKLGLGRIIGLRHRPEPSRRLENGVAIAPWSYYVAPPLPFFLSPFAVCQIKKEKDCLYVHALFALQEKQVNLLDGFMATLCYSFFDIIKTHWGQLCEDIEHGSIWEEVDVNDETRKELNKHLIADPKRAAELRIEFKNGMEGIAKRVWPELKAVHMVASGAFKVYSDSLMKTYIKGLHLISIPHAASEATVGLCMSDDLDDMTYTMQPKSAFFEFIPETQLYESSPDTLLMDQLEVGESYEVVVTTKCGLYRYRLGDVIKITGHLHNLPIYKFQYRVGQALNLTWEKMPESIFFKAISATMQEWPELQLQDYTATESVCLEEVTGIANCYVLFIELAGPEGQEVKLNADQIKQFDDALIKNFELYASQRQKGAISQMQVFEIQTGGFQKLKYHMLKANPTMQFKMPRVLRKKEYLEFIMQYKMK